VTTPHPQTTPAPEPVTCPGCGKTHAPHPETGTWCTRACIEARMRTPGQGEARPPKRRGARH
jgi:hypothetical protein